MNTLIVDKKAKIRLMLVFLTALLLYLIYWFLDLKPGLALLGLPLLLFFPGKFLAELNPALNFGLGKLGQLSLNIIYSFCLVTVAGFLVQQAWGFNSDFQIWTMLLINLILFAVYAVSSVKRRPASYNLGWRDFCILASFALAMVATIIVNPLAQNYDNYLVILKLSQAHNANLLATRLPFNSFIALVNHFTSIEVTFVYRNIFIIMFFSATLIVYDFLKRRLVSFRLVALGYLSLLIPSVILTQINYTMPQVVLVILTIPVLFLLTQSLRNKNTLASIVALVISIIAILFHQLSLILILVSLTVLFIHLHRTFFIESRVNLRLIVSISILIVLTIILFSWTIFRPSIEIAIGIIHSFSHLHFRAWFLNGFRDVDGIFVSFTGLNLIFYYFYNGILLLLILLYLWIILLKKKIALKFSPLAVIMYFSIFFLIAEVFPRLGIFFLPSRTWFHMMIAAVILLGIMLKTMEQKKIRVKFLSGALIVPIILGYSGTLYLVTHNIKKVYPAEMAVASYIRDRVPLDSVIISSQDNNALVNIYGDRKTYGEIRVDGYLTKKDFDNLVNEEIGTLTQDENHVVRDKLSTTIPVPNTGFNPDSVYFLYCFSQLRASNYANSDRQSVNDGLNRATYDKLGYPVVFVDEGALLIKVR